jgi:hypothetical protein
MDVSLWIVLCLSCTHRLHMGTKSSFLCCRLCHRKISGKDYRSGHGYSSSTDQHSSTWFLCMGKGWVPKDLQVTEEVLVRAKWQKCFLQSYGLCHLASQNLSPNVRSMSLHHALPGDGLWAVDSIRALTVGMGLRTLLESLWLSIGIRWDSCIDK